MCVDLNELLLKSLSEIEFNSKLDVEYIRQSSVLADRLYMKGNFSAAAKMASYALNYTSPEKNILFCMQQYYTQQVLV